MATTTPAKQKRGRPRLDRTPRGGDPREVILRVAAGLFADNGFAGTSTREIAEGAGLLQGSLYHYFKRKDDIFEALLDRLIDPPLHFAAAIGANRERAVVKFAQLMHRDAMYLYSEQLDVARIAMLPHARRPRFQNFWHKRLRLRVAYQSFIEDAVADGELTSPEPELDAELALGMIESALWWHTHNDAYHAQDIAQHYTGAALRNMRCEPATIEALLGALRQ